MNDSSGAYDSDIYVVDVDGTNLQTITYKSYRDRSPVWSPDSTRLAFTRHMRGLFIVDADGENLQQLGESDVRVDNPVWSPDGNRIAFARSYTSRVVVVDPDNGSSWQLTDEISSADPAWSPDGTRIALTREIRIGFPHGDSIIESSIFVVDSDGDNLIQLTKKDLLSSNPIWSPDGSCIAFVGYRNREGTGPDIFVINANGVGLRQLTDNKDRVYLNHIWSPDGTHIALVYSSEGMFVVEVDSTIVRKLADTTYGRGLVWSPDSTRLAFIGGSRNTGIFVVNADGTGLTKLTNDDNWYDYLVWSPDGKQIAFVTFREGRPKDITLVNLDDSSSRILAVGKDPRWSPDGTRILFINKSDIFVIDTDGTNLRRLTNNDTSGFCSRWSPDGTRIAFVNNRDRDHEIHIIDSDGSNMRQLTDNYYTDGCPMWSPAGG